jgi:glycosyltransferase involved in cell wall biosynthesis
MPAFNAEKYVQEAIESVLSQRFDRYELLVADDCSTDRTGTIIRTYARHPRVRVLSNARTDGAAVTRNRLIREAKGMYITPCDADDIMLPGNLRRLSEFLDHHPEIGVVYADILEIQIDENEELLEMPRVCGVDCNTIWDLKENVVNHGGCMSRKEVLLKVGGYDESVRSVDDWSLWLKVAEVARIHYLGGEVYYVWRRHLKSMTRTDDRRREDIEKIIRDAATRRGFQ